MTDPVDLLSSHLRCLECVFWRNVKRCFSKCRFSAELEHLDLKIFEMGGSVATLSAVSTEPKTRKIRKFHFWSPKNASFDPLHGSLLGHLILPFSRNSYMKGEFNTPKRPLKWVPRRGPKIPRTWKPPGFFWFGLCRGQRGRNSVEKKSKKPWTSIFNLSPCGNRCRSSESAIFFSRMHPHRKQNWTNNSNTKVASG